MELSGAGGRLGGLGVGAGDSSLMECSEEEGTFDDEEEEGSASAVDTLLAR